MITTIQLRRGTAAQWTSDNPVLHEGELGIETDTSKAKLGDGTTAWNSLGYWDPDGASLANYLALTGGTMTGPIAMGSNKITGLSNGSASGDAVAYGQLGSAAFQASSAFDAAGSAATAQAAAEAASDPAGSAAAAQAAAEAASLPLAGGTMTGPLNMGSQNISGVFTLSMHGASGSTAATRYVGATTAGPPTSGSYLVGDFIIAQAGAIYLCVTAGSPGSWTKIANLNTNVGLVQPSPGTAIVGATGNAADAGHVHGQPPMFAPTGLTGATAASRYVGATASGAPTSGTFNLGDWVLDQTGTIWICTTAGTPGTWTNPQAASLPITGGALSGTGGLSLSGGQLTGVTNVSVTGRSGAQNASRYVGATTSGAPTSGTFSKGDFVVDQSGSIWVCATAGTPGSWNHVAYLNGSAGSIQPTGTAAAAGGTGTSADAGHVHVQCYGNVFGDGSDGAVTLDGTTTFPFASLAGSTYTLSRDVWATNLTINSGVTLKGAYAIYCCGTFTNNGIIQAPSNAASGAVGGAATSSGTLGYGYAGASGSTGAGTSAATGTRPGTGNGGNGGTGTSGAGGNGGTSNASGTQWYKHPGMFVSVYSGVYSIEGGFGGGSGAGDGTNSGGGGGSGAGPLYIAAWAFVNNGQINAPGGAGGTPAAGNTGGGGGGGGGLVLIYTLTAWTNNGSTNVAGGAAGSARGTGTAGTAGSAGTVVNFVLV